MRLRWLWFPLLLCGLCSGPAAADNRVIVRTTLGLQGLQQFCGGLPLLQNCTVVGGLGDPLGQLFLITTPLDLTSILNLLGTTVGIVDAEADQLLNLVGGLNQVTTPPSGLLNSTPGKLLWIGRLERLCKSTCGANCACIRGPNHFSSYRNGDRSRHRHWCGPQSPGVEAGAVARL